MTRLADFILQGLALGTIYALIALGFVIIYKSTQVINFAHGAIMLLGAYLVFQVATQWSWPFFLGVLAVLAVMALFGVAIERTVIGPMVGQPVYSVVMITLGLEVVIRTFAVGLWTPPEIRTIADPWGSEMVSLGDVQLSQAALAAMVTGGVLIVAFFLFFRYSRTGVAMRATASDQETAMAMGIRVRRVFAISWAIAAVLATIAGVFTSSAALGGTGVLEPPIAFIALRAFPAAVIGGLDSPGGAVVGGLTIGLIEIMTGGYLGHLDFLGDGFKFVAPYLIMLLVLLVRPTGLFGTQEIERV